MKLLNKYTASAQEKENATYIGRGSPFGNPYVIGTHGTREQVIAMYRTYLKDKLLQRDPVIETAMRSLKPDSGLLCFCTPKPCHGAVVNEYHNTIFSEKDYESGLRALRNGGTGVNYLGPKAKA